MTTSKNFWQGDKVRLRPLRAEDWRRVYEEEDDSEGIRVLEGSIQLMRSVEHVRALIEQSVERAPQSIEAGTLSWVIENLDGEMVGVTSMHGRNPRTGTFNLMVRIYRAYRGQGYAQEALQIVMRYGFHELRYQKANSATIDINETSIQMHQSLGFQIEGRLRRNGYTGGQFRDEILFGMTREEFDERYGKNPAA